jgi:hypothetical protein
MDVGVDDVRRGIAAGVRHFAVNDSPPQDRHGNRQQGPLQQSPSGQLLHHLGIHRDVLRFGSPLSDCISGRHGGNEIRGAAGIAPHCAHPLIVGEARRFDPKLQHLECCTITSIRELGLTKDIHVRQPGRPQSKPAARVTRFWPRLNDPF